MMKYINKVTGAVIEAHCELSGGDWEPLREAEGSDAGGKVMAKKPGGKNKKQQEE